MIALAFAASLACAPAPVQPEHGHAQVHVLVAETRAKPGVEPEVAQQVAKLLALRLSEEHALVITGGDELRAVLDAEAQRQLAGCKDGSCYAELAAALNADVIVAPDVARLGGALVVDVTAVHAKDATTLARARARIENLDELGPRVDDAAAVIARALTGRAADGGAADHSTVFYGVGGAVAVVGAAGVIAGGVPLVGYALDGNALADAGARYQSTGSAAAIKDVRRAHAAVVGDIANLSTWGWLALGAGAASLFAGVAVATAPLWAAE